MRLRWLLPCAALLAAAAWLLRPAPSPPPAPPARPGTVTALLAGEAQEGFARATAPRPFRFPEDHGPHPEFRHEWWYFTGNLRDPGGRRFGYQLTFFRFALSPDAPPRESRWGASQAYMAHFSVTDEEGNRFRHFERTGREALGIAGASARPFRVRIDGWSAEGGAESLLPVRLRASEGGSSVDLLLHAGKAVVPQGERGLSRKSAAPGNASYYYSITRLSTRGTVRIDGTSYTVEGNSWLDREWGTSALGPEHEGWDWFALRLSDGSDLMLYRLRRRDGTPDPFSAGTLVRADGSIRTLSAGDFGIETLAHWRSPASGIRYPSRWKLRVPSEGIALEAAPRVADQELRTFVRYWEGAVGVRGTSGGKPAEGEGYVELTGYGE
ncbi:MAG: lipocalin-like domain-containing protein [Thermodesulfobacteriota bacterium]